MPERNGSIEKVFDGKVVYFSFPMTGEPHPDPYLAESIVNYLLDNGATLLSRHVAARDKDELNSLFIKESGMDRRLVDNPSPPIRQANIEWVDEAQYFAAVVDVPSTGTGILLQEALRKHKMGMNLTPVLCLISNDEENDLTHMVKGISEVDSPVAQVRRYVNRDHAKRIIREFLLKY